MCYSLLLIVETATTHVTGVKEFFLRPEIGNASLTSRAGQMIEETDLAELMLSHVRLRLVEPHLYTVYEDVADKNVYDRMRPLYDRVMGNRLYNSLMWGYRITDFASFCQEALAASSDGWVLDAGCGSLIFTARTYAHDTRRPVILLDQSIEMLQAAKSRLLRLCGEIPSNVVFLHGDALNLPFHAGSFRTVICMNLLHVLPKVREAVLGLQKAGTDEGALFFTTLVADRKFGDRYMRLLSGKGLIVPRTSHDIVRVFHDLNISIRYRVTGNMMFISCA